MQLRIAKLPLAAALAAAFAGGVMTAGASAQDTSSPNPTARDATASSVEEATLPPVPVVATPLDAALGLDAPAAAASRLGITVRELPASVSVVPRETIERRGASNTQEILRSVPGITAASPPGSAGSVWYRGFGNTSITQLFNGITVQYDAIAARPVDSWIYDRVEVVGGPSSYLHGSGAVGGAIDYVTKLATRDEDFIDARAGLGSFGSTGLALGANRRLGASNAVRLDVNRSASDGWVDGNDSEAWQVAASLLTDLRPGLSHTLAIEYQDEDVERPYWGTPLLEPTTGEGRIDRDTRFENYNSVDGFYGQEVRWLRSVLDWQISARTRLRNTFYHYDALRDYRNVEVYRYGTANSLVSRSSAFLQRHDQLLNGDRVELMHEGELAGHESDWVAGVDYSVNKQRRYPRSINSVISTVHPTDFVTEHFFDIPGMSPDYQPDRDNRLQTLAVFLENRTRLAQPLAIVLGLRHERIDLEVQNKQAVTATNPAFFERVWHPTTGRIGLVYDLGPGANVYVQVATAADPPAGILTTASFAQIRDFDLTTGRQAEAGAKFDFAGGRGAATIAAYHIVRKDFAVADPDAPGTTIPVGQQSSRGIEIAAALRVTPRLTLEGNAAYVDAQFDEFTENVGGVAVSREGKTPPNVPDFVGNLWIAYAITPALQVGADLQHVSSRYGNNANTVSDDAYTLVGAHLAYRVGRDTVVTLRGRNLTDQIYAAAITGTPMFYLGAPRSVELSVQTRFR